MRQGLTEDVYRNVHRYTDHEFSGNFTERELLAIEFGEQFALDHKGIDTAMFDRLKQHFSEREILELAILAAYCVGVGRAFQVLDIARDFDVLWSAEPPEDQPSGSA